MSGLVGALCTPTRGGRWSSAWAPAAPPAGSPRCRPWSGWTSSSSSRPSSTSPRVCSTINQDVLNNPKVHLVIGDGREVLLTTPADDYDLIFSEPSNPYRAGVASLFSADFYQAVIAAAAPRRPLPAVAPGVRARRPGGAHRLCHAGLGLPGGRELAGAPRRPAADGGPRAGGARPRPRRARASAGALPHGLARTWGVDGVEGFYSGYVADSGLRRAVAGPRGRRSTPTTTRSWSSASPRTWGASACSGSPTSTRWWRRAARGGPATRGAPLDWSRVAELRVARGRLLGGLRRPIPSRAGIPPRGCASPPAQACRRDDRRAEACARWFAQPEPPRSPRRPAAARRVPGRRRRPADAGGRRRCSPREQPIEAELVLARWHAGGATAAAEAGEHLLAAFAGLPRRPLGLPAAGARAPSRSPSGWPSRTRRSRPGSTRRWRSRSRSACSRGPRLITRIWLDPRARHAAPLRRGAGAARAPRALGRAVPHLPLPVLRARPATRSGRGGDARPGGAPGRQAAPAGGRAGAGGRLPRLTPAVRSRRLQPSACSEGRSSGGVYEYEFHRDDRSRRRGHHGARHRPGGRRRAATR